MLIVPNKGRHWYSQKHSFSIYLMNYSDTHRWVTVDAWKLGRTRKRWQQGQKLHKVRVMKGGYIIIMLKKHVRATQILTSYHRKETNKSKKPHTVDKLNKLIDHFAMLSQHEHLSNVESEEEDISLKAIQQPWNTHTDQTGKIKKVVVF